ncbi:MAG: amidase family protein, partial [Alphaproteobacteria bacterium]
HAVVPSNPPACDVAPPVRKAFEGALDRLARAGCTVRRRPVAALEEAHRLLTELGNPVTAHAQAEWGELVRRAPEKVFAPIRSRIAEGEGMSAETLARLNFGLQEASRELCAEMAGEGPLLMPAVSMGPPPLNPLLETPAAHAEANLAALKLTRLANFLTLASVTVPAGATAETADGPALPFGVMLTGAPHSEGRLLRMAAALETCFAAPPHPH